LSHEGSVLHRVAVFKTSGVALAGRARGAFLLGFFNILAFFRFFVPVVDFS